MKKILAAALLLFGTAASMPTDAQARVSVNINIGTPVTQSPWYATDDDYYYLPEQGVYYNVSRRVYVYNESGRWMYARNLPGRYNGFSWNKSNYVRIRDRSPFNYNNVYANRFDRNYRGGHITFRRDMDNRVSRFDRTSDKDRHDNNGRNRGWDRR